MVKPRFASLLLALLALCVVVTPSSADVYAAEYTGEVLLGGFAVGIDMYSEGPIVCEVTADYSPDGEIMAGDTIRKINGVAVHSRADMNALLAGDVSLPLEVSVLRDDREQELTIMPQKTSGDRLDTGFRTKDGIGGLGTVTCVDESGRFYALGHPISDAECSSRFSCRDGYIYECEITGAKRPSGGKPGRLVGRYTGNREAVGRIEENSDFGLRGSYNGSTTGNTIRTMSRSEVRPGKAYVYTMVGSTAEMYEVQIVKTVRQNGPSEKGMVIRVTDERLLAKTSGILQGMSGSPIIQDGKLAGAVTHVFTNDATRGYGVYIEWILQG